MNKFFSLLALAAVAFTAPLQAATVQMNLTDATEVTTDNFAAKGYTVEVLAVHRDGKRAFFMGNALVVGIIERVGSVLLERVQESKGVVA